MGLRVYEVLVLIFGLGKDALGRLFFWGVEKVVFLRIEEVVFLRIV